MPKLTVLGNGGDGILQAAALGPHDCTYYAGPSSARQSTPFTPSLPHPSFACCFSSSSLMPHPALPSRNRASPLVPTLDAHSGAHPRTPPLPSPCSQQHPHLASVGAEQSLNHRGFSEPLRLTHLGPWCLTRFKMQAGPSGRDDSGPPTDARLCSRNKGSILKRGDSGPG